MSIRARLLILVLAVWVPAAAGFGLFAWRTYDTQVQQARLQVEQMANAISSVVERELDKRALLASTLATLKAVEQEDFARFHEEASQAIQGRNDWAVLVDATHHYAHTLVPFSGTRVPRAIQAPLTQSKPIVLFVPQGAVTKQALICVFAGPPNPDPPKYNVGVAFDVDVLQTLLATATLPMGGVIALIDDQQRVMARSRDPAKWLGQSATGDIQRRAASRSSGFAESVTLDGVPSLTYLSPPNLFGWAVVIGMPHATLAQKALAVTTQALAAAGVLLFIGLGLALSSAHGLGNIVLALRDAAMALGNAQAAPRSKTGIREVDEVRQALDVAGMRIKEVNDDLERKVHQAVEQAKSAQAKLLTGQRHEAIGRLTGGIAHDFNNLLQTIRTAHHLVGQHLPGEPQRRVLQGAIRATSKAADLVRQLLTFGRAQPLEPKAINMGDMLLYTQELTAKAVGERIALSATIEPDLPCLFVDPTQFELAVLNLVFNARDAIPDAGQIIIRARRTTAAETAHLVPGQYVRVEVSDTGVGMVESVRAHVFEPYFTTKRVGAGTGLGLAQVEAFARQSGGDVGLTSAPGVGTTIALTLPAADGSAALDHGTVDIVQAHAQLRVLMVEDDALVSSLVVSALQAEGHDVTLRHTADEAVSLLHAGETFDVVFTDIVMPGRMNGMDLVKWCQQHRPDVPTLVATGYAERLSDVDVRVLRKPYGLASLLGALQEAHARATAKDGPTQPRPTPDERA